MSLEAILLDRRPAYLGDGRAASLLLCPTGPTTLLESLREQLLEVGVGAVAVVPDFDHDEEYARALRAISPSVDVVAVARLDEFLDQREHMHEPSDLLLIVDVERYPRAGFGVRELLQDTANCRLVRHLVQLRRNSGGTRERVVCDGRDRVQAIRRFYDGVTQVEAEAVCCSLLSVATARHAGNLDLRNLWKLRMRLAVTSVPSRDITVSGTTFDLNSESGLLALSEHRTAAAAVPPPAFTQLAPGIWAGPGCEIHPSSRLYGPVILHQAVTVKASAIVIGPTVVGAGAHVGRHATVSQSLIGPGAHLAAETSTVRRVIAPGATVTTDSAGRVQAGGQRAGAAPWRMAAQGGSGAGATNGWRLPRRVKRAFDLSTSFLGLMALSPFLLLAAVLVKLTSRGPALFGHEREGRSGKVFRCWKYRTMVDRAHAQQRALYTENAVDGPQFKLPSDPRVTRVGHWLRKTNIDELPQLINVLRGQMSLIGPRPSPFRENQICVPWRNARLSTRPGITGLWQVCRHERAAGDFHQWIYFDMLYVRHWSLGLDLRIMLATILTMGGRWSVPLSWMIPARKLRRASQAAGMPGPRPRPETVDAADRAQADTPAEACVGSMN